MKFVHLADKFILQYCVCVTLHTRMLYFFHRKGILGNYYLLMLLFLHIQLTHFNLAELVEMVIF